MSEREELLEALKTARSWMLPHEFIKFEYFERDRLKVSEVIEKYTRRASDSGR